MRGNSHLKDVTWTLTTTWVVYGNAPGNWVSTRYVNCTKGTSPPRANELNFSEIKMVLKCIWHWNTWTHSQEMSTLTCDHNPTSPAMAECRQRGQREDSAGTAGSGCSARGPGSCAALLLLCTVTWFVAGKGLVLHKGRSKSKLDFKWNLQGQMFDLQWNLQG